MHHFWFRKCHHCWWCYLGDQSAGMHILPLHWRDRQGQNGTLNLTNEYILLLLLNGWQKPNSTSFFSAKWNSWPEWNKRNPNIVLLNILNNKMAWSELDQRPTEVLGLWLNIGINRYMNLWWVGNMILFDSFVFVNFEGNFALLVYETPTDWYVAYLFQQRA